MKGFVERVQQVGFYYGDYGELWKGFQEKNFMRRVLVRDFRISGEGRLEVVVEMRGCQICYCYLL